MSARSGVAAGVLVAWTTLSACSPGEEDVTYWKDVKPIVSASCEGCHTAGGAGPFALSTYEEAREHAASMAAMASTGQMPPWLPAPTIEYRDDRRLSVEQIETLRAWAQGGTLEGNRDDYVPPDRTSALSISRRIWRWRWRPPTSPT